MGTGSSLGCLVAVDPGKRAGIALFAGEYLFDARDFDGDAPLSIGQILDTDGMRPDRIVCEIPHAGVGRATIDDRIKLALRAGLICARVAPLVVPEFVPPSTWKGQQSKDACHAKARKLLKLDEVAIFDRLGPDGKDAIALGLWALNR